MPLHSYTVGRSEAGKRNARRLYLSVYYVKWGRNLLPVPSLCYHLVPKLADNERLCLLNCIHEHLRDGAAEINAGNIADHGSGAAKEGLVR